MTGISTEYLAERIQETFQLAQANERLADRVHELGLKFDDFRMEITQKIGMINANLERFQGRTDSAFKVAMWSISVATTVAIAVLGSVVAGTWYASKFDSRIEQVESRLNKELPLLRRANAHRIGGTVPTVVRG
jgi:hypothetical protein